MRRLRPVRSVLLSAVAAAVAFAVPAIPSSAGDATSSPAVLGTLKPVVRSAAVHDVSLPLALMHPALPTAEPALVFEPERPALTPPGPQSADPVAQTTPAAAAIPAPNISFDGAADTDNSLFLVEPSDTNGEVGPNNYVQMVNSVMTVFDKKGNVLFGPVDNNTVWTGFPGICGEVNQGDPVVVYDQLADRWMVSQFAFARDPAVTGLPTGPFYECVAVSTTSDPTGSYNRYEFKISNTKLDDYPHFGVWPDGYYMSINQFDETSGFDFSGPGAVVFERDKMLTGDDARMVYFDVTNTNFGGQLPTDLDGTTLPPVGAPNWFAEVDDDANPFFASDSLNLFAFHTDWTDPTQSTFTGPTAIPVAAFDSVFPCNLSGDGNGRNCVPQPAPGDGLDAISDRLMFRASYRNFGDHESMVLNHTVDVNDPEGHAGIRWYELRDLSTTPTLFQQGTYAPDAQHRWMGSIAMDKAGDIALGFSVSNTDRYASLAYAGRVPTDTAGEMGQGENTLWEGAGAQDDGSGRWGDYSDLTVDPTNDCTFWFTSEYYAATGNFDWHTRIGSFTIPTCLGNGADLGVTQTTSPGPFLVNTPYTYDVTVTNNGPDAAPSARLVDQLPHDVTFGSVTPSQGSCSGTSKIDCQLGALGVGESATVTIEATAPAKPDIMVNSVKVGGAAKDPNGENNNGLLTLQAVDPCRHRGVFVAGDGGDSGQNVPPTAEVDIRSLFVAEPHLADGESPKLVFTLQVAKGSSVPPNSQWYIMWNRPTPDDSYDRDYVAMKSDATGALSYEYGKISPPNFNLPTKFGAADAGSYNVEKGRIQITVTTDKIDGVSAGSTLSSLQARTFFNRADGGPVTQLQSSDFGDIGLYTLVGNDRC